MALGNQDCDSEVDREDSMCEALGSISVTKRENSYFLLYFFNVKW